MSKFVPIEKMQKKQQKELAKSKRGSWLGVNPVTKVVPNRRKEKLEKAKEKDAFHF